MSGPPLRAALPVPLERHIFVFGSNLAGRHGKGGALHAVKFYGAIRGQGEGRQGQSYGIPTKGRTLCRLPLTAIEWHVNRFLTYARDNAGERFMLTPIGCGLAGYQPADIAPMFRDTPANVIIPDQFRLVLDSVAPPIPDMPRQPSPLDGSGYLMPPGDKYKST